MSKKIILVVGTRPEVIKMAPLYLALKEQRGWEPILLSTGQHRQMLDQTCAVFGIKPDIDLRLMRASQTLPDLTARILSSTAKIFEKVKPAAVLVQGDTTSAFTSCLSAFYVKIPVGHVEAGLRTYNYEAPWPEEMNRRLADPISRWCFAPTELGRQNLLAERIDAERIFVTGNTVIDALLWVRDQIETRKGGCEEMARQYRVREAFSRQFFGSPQKLPSEKNHQSRLVLVTGHRRESFGMGFENICKAIHRLVKEYPDVGVIYPVHLNPNVQEPVRRILGNHERIQLIGPMSYEPFVWLMNRAHFILSDSGGVQEEAPSLGKPVLVMRETTERPEGVKAGTCRLVGTDPKCILKEAGILLDNASEYRRRCRLKNPYGDGQAARRIVDILNQ